MPSVIFGVAARAELIEARDWYSARSAEVATRFIAEIETIVERIATAPNQFPMVYRDVRRARCRSGFPYALFFRMVEGTVHVIACFHSSRGPRQWQRIKPAGLDTSRETGSICKFYKMLGKSATRAERSRKFT